MSELCRLSGIDKLRTTAYKPSTNGRVESFLRTLNAMLGKVVQNNQRDWDERLPAILAAYRSTNHEATGYTPNYVKFGREARAPLDLLYGGPQLD
jgi:transposase InsO family protein